MVKLKISLTFVDSGGHFTQEVYEQCARRINKRVLLLKARADKIYRLPGYLRRSISWGKTHVVAKW